MSMKFTIISDSCCDLKHSEYSSEKFDFITVPITITLDEKNFSDEEYLDTGELLKQIKASKKVGTACPSPDKFLEIMREKDNIICITLSLKLSGAYNSARVAANTALEESPDKKIFVLDSLTASAGLSLILNKLMKIIETGAYKDFDDVTRKITSIAKSTKTRLLLQDFGILIKTGRIGKIAGLVASVLTLRTICGDNGAGEIKMYQKVIGQKRALQALGKCVAEKAETEGEDMPVVINHCNNETDAAFLKTLLQSLYKLKNIAVSAMRGVACLYASDKGLTLAY